MAFVYFLLVMLTVLMSSTVGTVLLVRAAARRHMTRRLARFAIVVLAGGLPLAVPLAVAAVFTQVIHFLPGAGQMRMQDAAWFNLAIFGSMACSLVLTVVGAVTGLRQLRQLPDA